MTPSPPRHMLAIPRRCVHMPTSVQEKVITNVTQLTYNQNTEAIIHFIPIDDGVHTAKMVRSVIAKLQPDAIALELDIPRALAILALGGVQRPRDSALPDMTFSASNSREDTQRASSSSGKSPSSGLHRPVVFSDTDPAVVMAFEAFFSSQLEPISDLIAALTSTDTDNGEGTHIPIALAEAHHLCTPV